MQREKEDYDSEELYLSLPQIMQTTNKHTYNLQVDALCHLFVLGPEAAMWRRLLSCS